MNVLRNERRHSMSRWTPARIRKLVAKCGFEGYTAFARHYAIPRMTIYRHLKGYRVSRLMAAYYLQIERNSNNDYTR